MPAASELLPDAWRSPDGVFERLAGTWSLARSIDGIAEMNGSATFAPRADGALAYRETGKLRLPGGRIFDAESRYLFRAGPQGFSVFFADAAERLFHAIVLQARDGILGGGAEHICRDDTYVSTYEFRCDGSFTIAHDVAGPAKSYRSYTTYRH